MRHQASVSRQHGLTLIEVLVSLVLVLLGLLGLAGLQSRAQIAENESYQRVQALILLRDMADRISANRFVAAGSGASYATGETFGKGYAGCSAITPLAAADLCEWDQALKGAAESIGTCNLDGTGGCVGAMLGARGCVTRLTTFATPPTIQKYLVQVAWQGLGPTSAPVTSLACGLNQYGNENLRRVVSTVVEIATLD